MVVQIGDDRYDVVEGFLRRPKGWTFVDVADVGVDADDNVFVFSRSPHPVMIFDREGRFLDSWGELDGLNYFTFPHGLSIGRDGYVYTADSRDHTVRKWTRDGHHVLTIGVPHQHAPAAGQLFYRPSHATAASNGDIYVSDGHGNAQVHVFDSAGEHRFSWGTAGTGPGQFNVVHSIFVDRDDGDRVYVADRFNDRIQFFTPGGEYIGEWGGLRKPQSIKKGPAGEWVVAELSPGVTVLGGDGQVIARWGEGAHLDDTGRVRHEPGSGLFCAPHGIAVDSRGTLHVAEASEAWAGLDRGDRAVQTFVRR